MEETGTIKIPESMSRTTEASSAPAWLEAAVNITCPVPPAAGSSTASTTSRAGKASSDPAAP